MNLFRKLLLVIGMIAILAISGCSTLVTQKDKAGEITLFAEPHTLCFRDRNKGENYTFTKYYSGVSLDLHLIFLVPFSSSYGDSGLLKAFYPLTLVYSIADLPFSLLGDTLVFPYNYYCFSNCDVIYEKAWAKYNKEHQKEKTDNKLSDAQPAN